MKDLKLSTELASAVLGLNVVYTESCEHRDGIIGIWTNMNTKPIKEINLYEFAFKCKEWALTKGYMMKIENHYSNSIVVQIRKTISNSAYIEPWKKTFRSEVEAIIKACEWILKNKAND